MTSTISINQVKLKTLATSASALTLLIGGLIMIPDVNAQTTCRHNEFMGTTTCDGPGGSYTGRHNEFMGTTTWDGPGGSVTCRYNDFMNTTTCD